VLTAALKGTRARHASWRRELCVSVHEGVFSNFKSHP
jgi:hypothetical protein